jgi:hypothetical protein
LLYALHAPKEEIDKITMENLNPVAVGEHYKVRTSIEARWEFARRMLSAEPKTI